MLKNYIKIAWRYLIHNRIASVINIGGLAVGMTVAILIGLWIVDELTFNQVHNNYKKIAQVFRQEIRDGEEITSIYHPMPLVSAIRSLYGRDFKYLVMARQTEDHLLTYDNHKFNQQGSFIQEDGPDLLTLTMLAGSRSGLKEPHSILLSVSLAGKLFGRGNAMGQVVKIDRNMEAKVTGIYADLPDNSDFKDAAFFAPFDLYVSSADWIKASGNDWGNQFVKVYAQLAPGSDFEKESGRIRNIYLSHIDPVKAAKRKPSVFLQPMAKWHLYSKFENGVNVTSDELKFVWFYGIIGAMVLLMACINFMNLSTARSQKRAKEVGIRKSMGSGRKQLIFQFFGESLLVAVFAFIISIALVNRALPWFNTVACKNIALPYPNPLFWLAGLTFILLTGLLAGSYPALYLSGFKPVKVLKGNFRIGSLAALPRKGLVVVQFTVSIALIIGTLIVYRQLQFTKDRPVGYNQNSLLTLQLISNEYKGNFALLRNELKKTGVVQEMAESGSPLTGVWSMNKGFDWIGKDASASDPTFNTITISSGYGKTIGWKFIDGRDFSPEFSNDSSGFVINEAAAKLMGFKNPVGQTVKWATEWRKEKSYHIVGIVKDMVMESPYTPVNPAVFFLQGGGGNMFIRINPATSATEALSSIGKTIKTLVPDGLVNFQFANEAYGAKFSNEERIGKLAGCFAVLAIFISCLGVFGMASFLAEQRRKEIGIRKVLGASVFNLWGLLTVDFLQLIILSLLIASPIAWYFMHNWLQNYAYRTGLSWWIFVVAGLGTLGITLLTIGYQGIRAAMSNPVKSLRAD
ncbi:FtsX-like permease family protein [Flavitalea flava]